MLLKMIKTALFPLILFACFAGTAHAGTKHVPGVKTQTLASSTDTVKAGYYAATTLHDVDTNLAPENIKDGVTIFGILGTHTGFCTAKGGKNVYSAINGDGVYCDNSFRLWTPTFILGGIATIITWGPNQDEPSDSCVGLGAAYPACNYCDSLIYAGHDDWVLPSCAGGAQGTGCQLYVFGMDACGWTGSGNQKSCAPSWDANATAGFYWSSSELVSYTPEAYSLNFGDGYIGASLKSNYHYIRCVRGP
ncbi:MAG: DUF1566 domain-containing protein [Elusimicrobia bacterium]|nr:DUF1566 domain-containing protein [Elusimicrobiota bacterium]